jgi:hypothetical protein
MFLPMANILATTVLMAETSALMAEEDNFNALSEAV